MQPQVVSSLASVRPRALRVCGVYVCVCARALLRARIASHTGHCGSCLEVILHDEHSLGGRHSFGALHARARSLIPLLHSRVQWLLNKYITNFSVCVPPRTLAHAPAPSLWCARQVIVYRARRDEAVFPFYAGVVGIAPRPRAPHANTINNHDGVAAPIGRQPVEVVRVRVVKRPLLACPPADRGVGSARVVGPMTGKADFLGTGRASGDARSDPGDGDRYARPPRPTGAAHLGAMRHLSARPTQPLACAPGCRAVCCDPFGLGGWWWCGDARWEDAPGAPPRMAPKMMRGFFSGLFHTRVRQKAGFHDSKIAWANRG